MSSPRLSQRPQGPTDRGPSSSGQNTRSPGGINRNSGAGHPDFGPDEPLGPLFESPPPRLRLRPVHPDLAPAHAASSLADSLDDRYRDHLRRFAGVFRIDVEGVPCPVSLVVLSDPALPFPPTSLTWEIDEGRADGLAQQYLVSVRPRRVPECSCSEFERDWDCRHIRALQRIGILASPIDVAESIPCEEPDDLSSEDDPIRELTFEPSTDDSDPEGGAW